MTWRSFLTVELRIMQTRWTIRALRLKLAWLRWHARRQ